jgi:hypothetical protein
MLPGSGHLALLRPVVAPVGIGSARADVTEPKRANVIGGPADGSLEDGGENDSAAMRQGASPMPLHARFDAGRRLHTPRML